MIVNLISIDDAFMNVMTVIDILSVVWNYRTSWTIIGNDFSIWRKSWWTVEIFVMKVFQLRTFFWLSVISMCCIFFSDEINREVHHTNVFSPTEKSNVDRTGFYEIKTELTSSIFRKYIRILTLSVNLDVKWKWFCHYLTFSDLGQIDGRTGYVTSFLAFDI